MLKVASPGVVGVWSFLTGNPEVFKLSVRMCQKQDFLPYAIAVCPFTVRNLFYTVSHVRILAFYNLSFEDFEESFHTFLEVLLCFLSSHPSELSL